MKTLWKDIEDRTAWRIGGSNRYTLKRLVWYTKHEWNQCHSVKLSVSWFKANVNSAWSWYSSCLWTFFDDLRLIYLALNNDFIKWWKGKLTQGIFIKYAG